MYAAPHPCFGVSRNMRSYSITICLPPLLSGGPISQAAPHGLCLPMLLRAVRRQRRPLLESDALAPADSPPAGRLVANRSLFSLSSLSPSWAFVGSPLSLLCGLDGGFLRISKSCLARPSRLMLPTVFATFFSWLVGRCEWVQFHRARGCDVGAAGVLAGLKEPGSRRLGPGLLLRLNVEDGLGRVIRHALDW